MHVHGHFNNVMQAYKVAIRLYMHAYKVAIVNA
jgi:hypothetical protein